MQLPWLSRQSVHTIITELPETKLTYDGYTSDTTNQTGTFPGGGTSNQNDRKGRNLKTERVYKRTMELQKAYVCVPDSTSTTEKRNPTTPGKHAKCK